MKQDLTRIDCDLIQGYRAPRDVASMALCNPGGQPGRMLFVAASAARGSISSQVAHRLSVEHFLDGITQALLDQRLDAVSATEAGFRVANTSVYSFGHKLAAGGRLAASMVSLFIEAGHLCVGRAGIGSAYLFRDGSLYPFFENPIGGDPFYEYGEALPDDIARKMSLVGAHSVVDVDIASLPLMPADRLVVLSRVLGSHDEKSLAKLFMQNSEKSLLTGKDGKSISNGETLAFGVLVRVGPEAIYLHV